MFWSWPLYLQVGLLIVLALGILVFSYSRLGELINWNYTSERTIRRKGAAVSITYQGVTPLHELGCQNAWSRKSRFFGLAEIRQQLKAQAQHKALDRSVEVFTESGSNTHSRFFLGKYIIVTIEPANVQTVLATDFQSFGLENQRRGFLPMLGHGIFSTDGPAWKHSRESLRPSFTRSQISDVLQFETHVQHLIEKVPRDGSTIDLQPLFFDLAMDISTEFLFGESTNALAGETMPPDVAKFVQAWNDCSNSLSGEGGRKGLWGLFFEDPSFKKHCSVIHDFVDKMIAKKIAILQTKGSDDRDTFLGGLLENITSPIKLRSECLNVLLAGRDTTSALLGNLFWIISHRNDIEAHLREEIAALPSPVEYEDLKNLKYLRALINESLRLHPIVPRNMREAVRDTILPVGGGADGKNRVFVPKGGLVGWNLYAMHRRKDIYGADADEFKPERWLDSETSKGIRPGWGYLPFNGGPRICIGQQFAITETSYVVVRLLQEFPKIETRDPEPWTEHLLITCNSFNGCKVAVDRKP